MSILKRQRELRKAEKAARKRARRHGLQEEGSVEPRPTLGAAQLLAGEPPPESSDAVEGEAHEGGSETESPENEEPS
jgi:hypothetical protein